MARLVTGIVAHVDAGKTTLSEALLYSQGAIRKLGRVDSRDSFLDSNSIERSRGITIFSKTARLSEQVILIDTPGHIDFGAEMERTLAVLDVAILLISGPDGIQAHTKTLWKLLEKNRIPAVIFINKMDMPTADRDALIAELKHGLSEAVTPFEADAMAEAAAATDDTLLEAYLDGRWPDARAIMKAVLERKVFPCLSGSALKLEGVDTLLTLLGELAESSPAGGSADSSSSFRAGSAPAGTAPSPAAGTSATSGAGGGGSATISSSAAGAAPYSGIVYKITHDSQNNRLTHLKVTDGILHAKDLLGDEKINEIRLYSGDKYENAKEACAGEICAVTGLKDTYAGMTFGNCRRTFSNQLEPALMYAVTAPPEIDTPRLLRILRELEEELPELKVECSQATKEICLMLMGEVQTEVLRQLVKDRFGFQLSFGEGRIAYKETITAPVRGVGHYEPLKHYAEVHLLLTPRPSGAGMSFISEIGVDELATNWQRLILTHLKEKQHAGILTGSPITDIEIRVTAGRDHLKHTEGGDFRQATYRAVRQALMQSQSILLEPYYTYEAVVPENCTGRVMADAERMCGTCALVENHGGFAVLAGRAPVSTMMNYMNEIRAFTKGQGTLSLTVDGYHPCHDAQKVIEDAAYNPDLDQENPSFSVFCSHGAGFPVPWDKVWEYQHIKD